MIGDSEAASALAECVFPAASEVRLIGGATVAPRYLGAGAALGGERERARGYYRESLEACERVRFRPEIALTRLHLAELLLDHYPDERAEALEHLDFAIAELRDMKMQPALERALRRREILKA